MASANKSTTIKDATDQELDAILVRLRKENDAQDLIGSLVRKSTPTDNSLGYYNQSAPISTEKPIESLYHSDAVENTLQHFGISGMRWGARRGSTPSGPSAGAKGEKSAPSEDHVKSRELKSKGASKLSTKDLQTLTQRMQLEKQLRDLNRADMTKGMDHVKALTAAGTTLVTLYGISKTPFGKDAISAIKGALSSRVMQVAYKKAMGG